MMMRVMVNGIVRDATEDEIEEHKAMLAAPPEYVAPTLVAQADIWLRMTDTEAAEFEAVLSSQPARIQNAIKNTSSYRSDQKLWPVLHGMLSSLFAEERCAQILAKS